MAHLPPPRLIRTLSLLALCALPALPYARFQGYAERGGTVVSTSGVSSATKVQASFPQAIVTVRNASDNSIATIYSDSTGTKKSNPFTADTTGFWSFYADDGVSTATCGASVCGTYNVTFSGPGIGTPFTLSGVTSVEPAALPRFVSDAGYPTLSAACSAAAAAGVRLTLSKTWDMDGTCAADIHAYKGGILKPANGHTITLTGSFDGDLSQHFDLSPGGKVVAETGFRSRPAYASWFGVTNDGVATSATLQRAYDALPGLHSNQLTFTPGTYLIDSGIIVSNGVETSCSGASFDNAATMFRAGANSMTMFLTKAQNWNNYFRNCKFDGADKQAVVAVYLDTSHMSGVVGCSFTNFDATSTAIKGGSNLFTEIGDNTFSMAGTAMDFINAYASVSTYYGIGVGNIHDNVISAGGGSRIGGNSIRWSHNDVEMKVNAESGAGTGSAVLFCDPKVNISAEMDGYNYFELTQGTASPMRAVGICPGSFSMTDTQIFGQSGTGDAVALIGPDGTNAYAYNLRISGVAFARWNNGINLGTGFTDSGLADSVILDNVWLTVTTPIRGLVGANNAVQTSNTGPPGATFSITDPAYGQVHKGAVVDGSALIYGASTLINVAECNVCMLRSDTGAGDAPKTYTGITGSYGPGNRFIVFGDGKDTLANAGFHMAANRDILLPVGVGLMFAIGSTGLSEVGNRSMDIPTTYANLGPCNDTHEGNHAPITNSNVSTFGAVITGPGTYHGIAWCDGANWTYR